MTSLKIYWFLIIAFLLILVEGCRKDDIIVDEPEDEPEIEVEEDPGCLGVYTDFFTDYPGTSPASGDYLAAYPGSWWVFSNGDSLYCSSADAGIYNLTDIDFDNCERFIDRINVHLPVIYGNYTRYSGNDTAYIYADSIIVTDKYYRSKINQQIDLTIDAYWRETGPFNYPYDIYSELNIMRKTVATYDSIELPNGDIYNDVVEILQVDDLTVKGGTDWWCDGLAHLFYAKEVGLIWEFDTLINLRERYLENYFIAPH